MDTWRGCGDEGVLLAPRRPGICGPEKIQTLELLDWGFLSDVPEHAVNGLLFAELRILAV